ncbi:MAG TPA: hypothetical protein VMT87_00940 [Vicinamibacteria bacterium]|nr:hypothetical protein [Vicinamibacteria bacterium]
MSARFKLPLVLALAVVVRVPFWAEALRTPVDGDTAIIGLMARHPARGVTMWGQPYGSPLEAWLAAPFVAAMGTRPEPLRLVYFLLGLGLVPLAWALGRALDPRAALPAALLLACPPPYFLALSALPPPMYPLALLLGGALLVLGLRAGERLAAGESARGALLAWGVAGGLALWTHLMTASVLAVTAVHLAWVSRRRLRALMPAAVALVLASAPLWLRAAAEPGALRIVGVTGRHRTFGQHLAEVLPRLHEPVGGLLGTHVPVVPDDPTHLVHPPAWAAAGLVLLYGAGAILAASRLRARTAVPVLVAAVAVAAAAFPLPQRSGPETIRFLTPAYLPLASLVAWALVTPRNARRALVLVLALASLHLAGARALLAAWRAADRAQAPFLLPDLEPVRRALEEHGVRRAYASYGPAYRLTFASGERLVASQPWNERFLHYPLPYLDEVRFAKGVAWVLTPRVPSDLPAPAAFEAALAAAGGSWRRLEVGAATVYLAFAPPFGPEVQPLSSAGAGGDLNPDTVLSPAPAEPTVFTVSPAEPLQALTLVAGPAGPRLPRSMDVEVSADGVTFETVARRRRRDEREDLRWVNGHPQYVIDHDLIAVPLAGRRVAAVRITPVASTDPWSLGEVLLHRAGPSAPWDEWLDPHLGWAERRRRLREEPRPGREDWYYRVLLARRAR